MPVGNLEIVHDFTAITGKVIITIAENSTPGAEVDRVVLDAPHTAGEVTIFDNLRMVLHRVRCYESSDGIALDTLLHSWTVQVKKKTAANKVWTYIVDRGNTTGTAGSGEYWADPVSDTTDATDERLKDAVSVVLLRAGGDLMVEGTDYSLLPGGGWTLLNGDKFSASERWMSIAFYDVDVVESSTGTGTGGGSSTGSIKTVDTDETLDTTYYNKKCIAAFTATIGTTTLPALASIPNGTLIKFTTFGGAQRYWTIQFASGESVHFQGKDRNAIHLGQNEVLELYFDQGVCYVDNYAGDYAMVGQYIFGNRKINNSEILDGKAGAEQNISDWVRLIEELEAEQICSYTEYDQTASVTVGDITNTYYKNHGKFAVNNGTGKFKFPDIRNFSFRALKNTDGSTDSTRLTQGAGGMQAQNLIQHRHVYPLAPNDSTGGGLVYGRGGAPLSTGTPHITEQTGGIEQAVDSISQYPLVII